MGSLAFVGDGPLRAELEGLDRVRLVGRVPHAEVARVDHGLRGALPAEHDRAVRSGAPRSDGERAYGRRDADRRPARVREVGLRRARRPAQRRIDRGRASGGNELRAPKLAESPRSTTSGCRCAGSSTSWTGGGISRCPIEQRSQPARPARRASTSGCGPRGRARPPRRAPVVALARTLERVVILRSPCTSRRWISARGSIDRALSYPDRRCWRSLQCCRCSSRSS